MYGAELVGRAGNGLSAPTPSTESLASIAPRVFVMSAKTANLSNHIAASLGLVPHEGATAEKAEQRQTPTLLQTLCEMEKALEFALIRLDAINNHLNG